MPPVALSLIVMPCLTLMIRSLIVIGAGPTEIAKIIRTAAVHEAA